MLPPSSRAQTDKQHCSTKSGVQLHEGRDLPARFSTCEVMLLKCAECCARELRSASGLGVHVGPRFFRLERDL